MNELQKTTSALSIAPVAATATTNGSSVDLKDAVGTVKVTAMHGVITTGTFAWKLQDSADDSTFADVSGGPTTAALGTDGAVVFEGKIDARKLRRYVRVVATGASTPNGLISASIEYVKQVI